MPTHRLIVIALACAGAVVAHPTKGVDELLLVQAVIRHGDRAATDYFATEESSKVLFRGLGELSDEGIDNAHKQGKDFKKRYVDTGFISDKFIPSQIKFRASGVNRVLMSCGSFSNALFRKTPEGGNPVVPPIYTKDYDDDPMLAPAMNCLDGWDDVVSALKLPNSVNVAGQALNKMESDMWPESCKGVPAEKVDAIIAELPNRLIKMPHVYNKCASDPAKKFMYQYLELLGGSGGHENKMRLKRTVGLLTNELMQNINEKANCTARNETCLESSPRMRVYYSHDVNVLALSHVFDSIKSFNGINPAFSSALVFELYRNSATQEHTVKVLLKNGQNAEFEDTGLCSTEAGCSLKAIQDRADRYTVTSPMPCERPPSS